MLLRSTSTRQLTRLLPRPCIFRALLCSQSVDVPVPTEITESAKQEPVQQDNNVISSESAPSDPTMARVSNKFGPMCTTPKEAHTNLIGFLNQSDVQKRLRTIEIPYFEGGCHVSVEYADPSSPTGLNKFVGICIARRNKGLGTSFILRNVIGHVAVERTFELYSPQIRKIEVLWLERRRRAKLYYLRDKPLKYSTVDWNAKPDPSKVVRGYRRARNAAA